jgi:hypothetical protein
LRDQYGISPSGVAGATYTTSIGLLEPLGRNPTYMTNYYDMYKYMRIRSVVVTTHLCNTTSTPLTAVVSTLPFSDVGITSFSQIAEQPQAQLKLISSAGGLDKVVFKRTYDCLNLVGNFGGDHWWITQAQSVSTSPVDSREPVFVLAIGPTTSVNWSCSGQVFIEYHVEFFDLQSTA